MKKHLEAAQRPGYDFDKPAKQRIIDASDKVFRLFGIRAGRAAIADEAHSNMETMVRYFGRGEDLVRRFVTSLIAESESMWRGIESEHPSDPEAQLRLWLAQEQDATGRIMRPEVLLSRTAAELQPYAEQERDLLAEIGEYWQAERRRVAKLCRAADLREPLDLADKLLLLVRGARSERDIFGRLAPSRRLAAAADDLLAAHGLSRRSADAPGRA